MFEQAETGIDKRNTLVYKRNPEVQPTIKVTEALKMPHFTPKQERVHVSLRTTCRAASSTTPSAVLH